MAAGFYGRKLLLVGQTLELAGQQGVLKAITTTHIVIESEGRETTISNETILTAITRQ